MLCSIIGSIFIIAVISLVLALLLQVASKIVLKEAIEFGDAFKAAFVASIVSYFVDMGLQSAFSTKGMDPTAIYWVISICTTYLIWVLALTIIVDLTLKESFLIGAVFTALKIVLGLVLTATLVALMAN